MSAPAIEVRVRKRLGAFRLDAAFEGAGEGVTVIFGPSGAGKSQCLAAVAGASRPDRGRVAIGDEVLFDSDRGVDVAMERRCIGWVFQDGRLFPHMSVDANLRYGERRSRGRDAGVRFGPLIEALGVGHLLSRSPGALSGGERQRVAIGRALLAQPRILLLDEPLAALDMARREDILPYLDRLKTLYRLPMLYVTHALSEVARLSDRLVVIESGQVLAQGPVAQVLARTDLAALPGGRDAVAILEGVVAGHDATRGVSRIDIGGGATMLAPLLTEPLGERVRLVVPARDVLLALDRPLRLSARNVLEGAIEAMAAQRDATVLVRVRLDATGAILLANLTVDAVTELSLAPGTRVFAVVKSMALEGGVNATPSHGTQL